MPNPQAAALAARMGPPPQAGPPMGGAAPGMGAPAGGPMPGGGGEDAVGKVRSLLNELLTTIANAGPDVLPQVQPLFQGFGAAIKSLVNGGQSPAGPGGGMATPNMGGPPMGGPMPPQGP